jgi:hypothetical protein
MVFNEREYTEEDEMTIPLLTRVWEAQKAAAARLKSRLGGDVFIEEPLFPQGEYTPAYPPLINIIERNLDRLCEGGYRTAGAGPSVTWRGELADNPRLSCRDVNRWFGACAALAETYERTASGAVITGAAACGGDKTRQIIRRVT